MNDIVVPAGTPDIAVIVIVLVNPPLEIVGNITSIVAGAGQVATAGVVVPKLNPNGGGVMVMLALLISKKILPIASTLILPVVVRVEGTVKVSVPSLAVLAANTVGKVTPPSVEKLIITFAQLIGAPVVPFTDQVTVCVVPAL